MAVDFLDIAPLEAEEWTVSVKDKDGQEHEVTVHPFDSSDLAYLARMYPRVRSIFENDDDNPERLTNFIEAKPYVVALGFVGSARMREPKTFNGAVAKVRAMSMLEQNRLFGAVWGHALGVKEEDGADPPTIGAAAEGADAASPTQSPSLSSAATSE